MTKIKFYGKVNCPPCELHFRRLLKYINESDIEKIIFQSNEEAIIGVEKFNTQFVPFIVINDNSVIHYRDFITLLSLLKSKK